MKRIQEAHWSEETLVAPHPTTEESLEKGPKPDSIDTVKYSTVLTNKKVTVWKLQKRKSPVPSRVQS